MERCNYGTYIGRNNETTRIGNGKMKQLNSIMRMTANDAPGLNKGDPTKFGVTNSPIQDKALYVIGYV